MFSLISRPAGGKTVVKSSKHSFYWQRSTTTRCTITKILCKIIIFRLC